MMKNNNFYLTIFLTLGLISVICAQPQLSESSHKGDCRIDNSAFKNQEKLVYKLYYNWKFMWIPAGEVTFTVDETEDHYKFSSTGKTYKSYDSFFKVRDYYYSTVDKETLYPVAFLRDITEGKYTRYDSILFDQTNRKAISHWGSKRTNAEPSEYELNDCMQDLLSILYFVRNLDYGHMEKGEKVPISIFFDKETYPLKVTYNGTENKKKIKDLGKFNTMKFTPEVVAGYVFDEDTTMKIWVSNDRNKVPLLIESPVSIGSIKAVLKSYDNLKYSLSSQVKED